MRRASADAQHSLDTRRPCLITYSVHASTMQHRERRQSYLKQLHDIPEALRVSLLGRIAEITPGTPKATIADWVHQLRSVSPRVTIELHSKERLADGWRGVGIAGVACVVPPIPQEGPKTERYARLIRAWGPILKREGLEFRMDNLNTPLLLACAVEHGVDRCTGDWLWPAVTQPEGIRPYSMGQFRAALEFARPKLAMSV